MILENLRNIFLFIFINAQFAIAIENNNAFINSRDSLFNSIIISEIMADPTPQILLPQFEYLEIYNRGKSNINLYNWTLKIGTYKVKLPNIIIAPENYVIICDVEISEILAQYGNVISITNFPPILNTGQVIVLLSQYDEIIHSIEFSDDWYIDMNKSEGGWSLEMIDTENPCGREDNWKASIDIKGGTPGKQNSVKQKNPDYNKPELLRATLRDDSSVVLYFSEPLHIGTALSRDNYSTDNNYLHPGNVFPVTPDISKLLLEYHQKFNKGTIYTTNVLNNLKDCIGNKISDNSIAKFAIPANIKPFDIVINEILFDARQGAVEFIELYNRSDKVLNLNEINVSMVDISNNELKNTISLKESPFILFPGDYVIITGDMETMLSYNNVSRKVILEPDVFIKLPDEEGMVLISDTDLTTIDKCQYNRGLYNIFLDNFEGISLERVNPDLASDIKDNWRCASASSGYSTPGKVNSQFDKSDKSCLINLSCEAFSPDNDGIDDEIFIHLQLNSPEWIGSIRIYDINGQLIKTLVKNQLFGTEEKFLWNGKTDDEKLIELGVYIIYCEIINSQGQMKSYKKVVSAIRK